MLFALTISENTYLSCIIYGATKLLTNFLYTSELLRRTSKKKNVKHLDFKKVHVASLSLLRSKYVVLISCLTSHLSFPAVFK